MKKKHIWICGRKWAVNFIAPPIVVDGINVFGCCDVSNQEIKVCASGVSEDVINSTLLHEIFHAILKTTVNGSIDSEETIVQALELGFFDFIKNRKNKWVLEQIGN